VVDVGDAVDVVVEEVGGERGSNCTKFRNSISLEVIKILLSVKPRALQLSLARCIWVQNIYGKSKFIGFFF